MAATEPDPVAAGNSSTASVTLNPATAADFTLTASSAVLSVNPGSTATYTATLTPIGGFNTLTLFTCTTTAAPATCTANPGSATPNGANPVTVQINVVTQKNTTVLGSSPISLPQLPALPRGWMWLLTVLAMASFWLMARSVRHARWARVAACFAALTFCGGLLMGCAHGPQTSKGVAGVTITASSGSISHSTTVELIVN